MATWQGGCLFFKENIVTSTGFVLDKEDNSITRSDAQYKELFQEAGMELVADALQSDFPQELFDVKMYAVR